MRYNSGVKSANFYGTTEAGKHIVRSTASPKTLFAFGINHKTAPVEIREKLHLREDEIPLLIDRLKVAMSECVVLSTCNRTEIYGVSESSEIDLNFFKNTLIDFKDARGFVRDDHFFALISCGACQQLFNVATSIDSKVIGDSQILRQLRAAYSAAQESGSTGKVLNQLMQRGFKLGKTTYTETSIHDGAVSVSLAAVELGVETYGSLRGRTALVIGAGQMARFTAEAFINKKISKILVTNRTRSHAEAMVSVLPADHSFECEILDFDKFKEYLPEVDMIVSSTGSVDPILFKTDFPVLEKRLLLIDIAVPRDVETAVAEVPYVTLRNIDELRSIIDGHQERRVNDLPKVQKMIVDEMVDFLTWYYSLPIMPNYERTGTKPPPEQTAEILKVKAFLNQNLSEIHRLAAKSGGDFYDDLESHFSLIRSLQTLKDETFAATAV